MILKSGGPFITRKTVYLKKPEETKKPASKENKVYFSILTTLHCTYNSEFLGKIITCPSIDGIL